MIRREGPIGESPAGGEEGEPPDSIPREAKMAMHVIDNKQANTHGCGRFGGLAVAGSLKEFTGYYYMQLISYYYMQLIRQPLATTACN